MFRESDIGKAGISSMYRRTLFSYTVMFHTIYLRLQTVVFDCKVLVSVLLYTQTNVVQKIWHHECHQSVCIIFKAILQYLRHVPM